VASLHLEGREERSDAARDLRLVLAAQHGRPGARAELIESFMVAIARIAEPCRGTHAQRMNAGVVGLLRALDRYDPSLGTPFWAYAAWWVRQAILRLDDPFGGEASASTFGECAEVDDRRPLPTALGDLER
jgi:DNA-directed RNA polymerase sigma subunit (sigma70/sigma32)